LCATLLRALSATMAALSMVFEKIASKDKDYRYMATSDLLNELQKDTFHMDGETERKICAVRSHVALFPAPSRTPWGVGTSGGTASACTHGTWTVWCILGGGVWRQLEGTRGGFEGRAPAAIARVRPYGGASLLSVD
jgi:hypothetical protein